MIIEGLKQLEGLEGLGLGCRVQLLSQKIEGSRVAGVARDHSRAHAPQESVFRPSQWETCTLPDPNLKCRPAKVEVSFCCN